MRCWFGGHRWIAVCPLGHIMVICERCFKRVRLERGVHNADWAEQYAAQELIDQVEKIVSEEWVLGRVLPQYVGAVNHARVASIRAELLAYRVGP